MEQKKEKKKRPPSRMFWGPYPEEWPRRTKQEICAAGHLPLAPSFLFSSIPGPSVRFAYSGLSFEFQLFRKQTPPQLIWRPAPITAGVISWYRRRGLFLQCESLGFFLQCPGSAFSSGPEILGGWEGQREGGRRPHTNSFPCSLLFSLL